MVMTPRPWRLRGVVPETPVCDTPRRHRESPCRGRIRCLARRPRFNVAYPSGSRYLLDLPGPSDAPGTTTTAASLAPSAPAQALASLPKPGERLSVCPRPPKCLQLVELEELALV